jgi:hypothetical protein
MEKQQSVAEDAEVQEGLLESMAYTTAENACAKLQKNWDSKNIINRLL